MLVKMIHNTPEGSDFSTMPKRVKHARKMSGYKTQTLIAEKIGVTRDAYARYETSADMPSDKLSKFYEATKFNIHWLLTGRGPMKDEADEFQAIMQKIAEDPDLKAKLLIEAIRLLR